MNKSQPKIVIGQIHSANEHGLEPPITIALRYQDVPEHWAKAVGLKDKRQTAH